MSEPAQDEKPADAGDVEVVVDEESTTGETPEEQPVTDGDAEESEPSESVPRSVSEHKLDTPWTFHFDKKLPKPADYANYASNLQKIGKFDTLEGFWRHYSHLKSPDKIPNGHNLFMFRHDYTPAWETFPKGGTWIIKVRKKNGVISRLWEELLFACVGERFGEPDIVGVMLSTKMREDFLSVWNCDNVKNPDTRFNIGEKLREILNLDESTQVEYKHFKTAIRDGSSFRNAQSYVYAVQTPQYS